MAALFRRYKTELRMLCTAHSAIHLTKVRQGDNGIMKNAAALCITGRVADRRVYIHRWHKQKEEARPKKKRKAGD